MRKYTIDENYLDVVDTEEKAYVLGLLASDGYNDEKRGKIQLSLKESDIAHVKLINKLLGSNRPLQRKVKRVDNKEYISWCLNIYSKVLSNRLCDFGITQNKSKTLIFTDLIPNKLIKHFIRGYFDGDGCISINTKIISIAGSEFFINSTKKYLDNVLNEDYKIYINKDLSILQSTCLKAFKLIDYLYKDSSIYLDRKYKKYLEFKENQDKFNTKRENYYKTLNTSNEVRIQIAKDYIEGKSIKDLVLDYKISRTSINRIIKEWKSKI